MPWRVNGLAEYLPYDNNQLGCMGLQANKDRMSVNFTICKSAAIGLDLNWTLSLKHHSREGRFLKYPHCGCKSLRKVVILNS
jgi:hypothetical protein